MAIELGKAYVQIMPSAKGISGSIQKAISPEALSAGKSAGKNIMTAISDSLSKAGSTLTKYITTPALGAATAVAGLASALGFKRLVGMDNAQAKLKGLGIEGKQLETVMENARNAVQGTTHTMADAANVAAGALAAGVKEGADLERYIKLVGDAATGANAPMGEMAQIFNRIQGTGKLMGTELEMIEYRLPGFSQALAKHLGVAPEKMREMVSEGKVSVDDFLAVMEGYAGGMSAAYAETWSGLKDNVLANIGIIGEALLEGLFEDGKKGMAEFLDYLRNSEGLKEWARETGETLRNVFATIVEFVKNAINWWTNLDGSTKNLIMTIAGIAVAIGPVLMVISKIIGTISTLTKGLTALKGGFMAAKAGEVVASGAMAKLGGVIATLLGPVGLIIGAVVGLIALFTVLYQKNEGFRDLVHNVWNAIKETISTVIQAVSDFVMDIWGGLVEWWNTNGEMIRQAAENVWNVISTVITTVMGVIWTIMQTIWPIIQAIIVSVWENIKGVIQGAINVITGIIQFFSALFTGNWSALWDSIKQIVSGAVQFVWNFIQLWFVGKILKAGKALFTGLRSIVSNLWNAVKSIFTSGVNAARNVVSTGFNFIRNIINTVMNAIRSVISNIWNGIRNTISNVVNSIRNTISNIFNSLRGIVSSAFGGVRSAVSNGMKSAFNTVKNFFGRFKDAGKKIVTSIADGIKGAISKVTDAISKVTQKIRNFLPFSPPKEGPLIDIMDVKWGETISAGILKGEDQVANAMDEILNFDLTKKATFGGLSKDEILNHYNTQQQSQPIILQVDGRTFAKITGDYTAAEGGNRIRRIERGLAT